MSYFEQQQKLTDEILKIYSEKGKTPGKDFVLSVYDLGDKLELTLEEVGNICELIFKILSGDKTIGSTETALLEILDEDNQKNMGVISAFINTEIINKIKTDLYGGKADLVPNPQEPVTPAINVPDDVVNTVPQINEAIYEKISREQILRDLENPPPAKFSTNTNREESESKREATISQSVPENLPTADAPTSNEGERIVPIVRTMSRDIAKQSGATLDDVRAPQIENTEKMFNLPRGKFGSGSIPQIKQIRSSTSSNDLSSYIQKVNPVKTEVPQPKIDKVTETPVPTPKQAPAPAPTPIPTPVPPAPKVEKTQDLSNSIENKLTKIVHAPLERKKYEVDPYRESLEN
jgi:hypothetical protein